eukprot:1671286-Rhodomonas_salina.2
MNPPTSHTLPQYRTSHSTIRYLSTTHAISVPCAMAVSDTTPYARTGHRTPYAMVVPRGSAVAVGRYSPPLPPPRSTIAHVSTATSRSDCLAPYLMPALVANLWQHSLGQYRTSRSKCVAA